MMLLHVFVPLSGAKGGGPPAKRGRGRAEGPGKAVFQPGERR